MIASEEFVKQRDLTPMGRIVSWAYAGVEPEIMGIGPVPASRAALAKAGLSLDDIDLVEVNEAFAVVPMALMADLKVPHENVNVNGGACALGHPIGASGARILVTLIHALQARGGDAVQLRQLRQQLVGNAATERLEALDRQRQVWQQRLADFEQEKSRIEHSQGLGEADKQAAIERLAEQRFDSSERLRLLVRQES